MNTGCPVAAGEAALRTVFPGESEMARRCRALDWAATPLGPVAGWPAAVRVAAALVLAAPVGMILLLGPELVQLYNDGYAGVMGRKHPGGLGQRNRECWPEAWTFTGPIYDAVLGRGEAFRFDDQRLVLERGDAPEEAFFALAYSPVYDSETGAGSAPGAPVVAGILVTVAETTAAVRARRELERFVAANDAARRAELEAANAQLEDHALELELANQQLQDQTVELELQAEELQATAGQLEERTEEAEEARARAEAVLESIADAFYLLDREWRFVHVNAAAEPLLQTTRAQLLGRTLWEAFPGVAGSVFEGPYREAMATGRPTSAEAYFAPLGTWFDVHSYPWAGGIMVHFRDIGARKAAEAERERLLAAAQAARAEVETAGGRLTFLADASARLLGETLDYEGTLAAAVRVAVPALADYAAVDMVAEDGSIRRLGSAHRDPEREPIVQQAGRHYAAVPDRAHPHADTLARGEPRLVAEVTDEWLVSAARSPEHLADMRAVGPRSLMLVPLRARDRVAGLLVLASTSSERRYGPADLALAQEFARRVALAADNARLFAEAEAARARAEGASRAKSEFLAVMSHELRTPLNAIGGYAELIELGIRGPVTDQQREDLARIQRSQRALLGLINEVLNYARLETGAVTYDLADVPVAEAVGAAEVLVAPQLRAKGLGYAWAGEAPGLAVRADRDKLQQILLNLLSNAIKFTNARPGLPGRVEVSCEAAGPGVRVRVRDTGVGIPADKLGAVFEPFVQVDAKLTRTHEGTGLGLAISRDLARGMGGDLTAESTLGVGSTFTLTLPAAGA